MDERWMQVQGRVDAVVMGASAGGVEALNAILPTLPVPFGVPIIAVMHLPPDRPSLLAEIFAPKCLLRVKESEDKEPLEAGVVYFAPPDYHLLVERHRQLALSGDEPVRYSRPSIDVLFESAAEAFGPRLLGILLTGANADGADGLWAIRAAGGLTAVQDPRLAMAPAMPAAALSRCAPDFILSLEQVAALVRAAGSPKAPGAP